MVVILPDGRVVCVLGRVVVDVPGREYVPWFTPMLEIFPVEGRAVKPELGRAVRPASGRVVMPGRVVAEPEEGRWFEASRLVEGRVAVP